VRHVTGGKNAFSPFDATFGNFFHRREPYPPSKTFLKPGTIPFRSANPSVRHSQTRSINQRESGIEKEENDEK